MIISRKTRLSCIALAASLSTLLSIPAYSSSLLIDANDGTYRTENVTSPEQCQEICKAEGDICRGTIILQMDTSRPEMFCRLNNGKGENPAFPAVAPKPWDIATALVDFNSYRAENGLKPVRLNGKLTLASKLHAQDMSSFGDASHSGSDGSSHSDRIQRQAYYFSLAAENVAAGQKSWEKVFKAWKKSPDHNVNLLRPDVTDFGIAMIYDPDSSYGTYWAMLVASPLAGHIQEAMARGDVEALAKMTQ